MQSFELLLKDKIISAVKIFFFNFVQNAPNVHAFSSSKAYLCNTIAIDKIFNFCRTTMHAN